MTLFTTYRVQDSLPALTTDGAAGNPRINNRAELVVPDYFTQMAVDGVVYNVSQAVQETAELFSETARGTDNINPSLLMDVPTGTTVIPLEIQITPESTGTAADYDISICTDDGIRFSSGGATRTPINMRKDDPNTSAVTVYSGATQIVAIANVDDDTIWYERFDSTELATPSQKHEFYWTARVSVPPILVGPAALLVFVITGNVDHLFFWNMRFAEFSTAQIT